MDILISLLINTIAVFVTAYILPGVRLYSFLTAMVVAIVLGFINTIIAPILFILTLPINILTLGLFTFVIMAFVIKLASWIVPGFEVKSFLWALAFSLVLSVVNSVIRTVF